MMKIGAANKHPEAETGYLLEIGFRTIQPDGSGTSVIAIRYGASASAIA